MGIRLIQVDAFTDEAFRGNPAAVCFLSETMDEGWMQSVAREMNLSETAFLLRGQDGFSLRWFTPAVEVDLCGHATLASAHALWEEGVVPSSEPLRFHTRSGLLTAEKREEAIELDFPATPETPCASPPGLSRALGAEPTYIGHSAFDYLVLLRDADAVRHLSPDMGLLKKVSARGIIVTALSDDSRFDFVSRFFAPAAGIDEDPVTGSAHCCLGPFWQARLEKAAMVAYQASARGGVVRVEVAGERVRIGGHAVTVLRADLLV
jgi:PhzF family phenazine biosynthesis protein